MRNTPTPRARRAIVVTLSVLLATLAGCSNNSQRGASHAQNASSSSTAGYTDGDNMQLPPSHYAEQFAIAEYALSRFDWMSASNALVTLHEAQAPLSSDDNVYLAYLTARIAYLQGRQSAASAQLTAINLESAHRALQYRIHNFQRHILRQQNRHLEAAQLSATILTTAGRDSQAAIKRALWADLQRCNADALQSAQAQTDDVQWAAWLELALLSRGDIASQIAQLPSWQAQNRAHPANNPLPGGMSFLLTDAPPPNTVALILPLSGKLAYAGKAVRDGYLAHYMTARTKEKTPQQVLILDSNDYTSPLEAYQDAVAQGAKLVVGPLRKDAVALLARQLERTVPVLALNRIDSQVTTDTSALVQMALAPEDEASLLAELAFGEGARRALILRPAGPWGEKMEAALTNHWLSLGGTISSSEIYTGRDDYAPAVKKGMGLASSEQRQTRVRDMLATPIAFAPRRRQDLNAIFMLSRNAAEARSIKPLFAFHYAGELPIYSTSSIYSGAKDRRDRDLNGINIVEMPWLLANDSPLKAALEDGGTQSSQLTRLNALGADAYTLQSRFLQLQGGADALIRGATGLLTMNSQLQIQRELLPAVFDRGVLTAR